MRSRSGWSSLCHGLSRNSNAANASVGSPTTLRLVLLREGPKSSHLAHRGMSVNALQNDVLQLWGPFHLDPTALYLVSRNFRVLNNTDRFCGAKTQRPYIIVWTYQIATQSTNGVAIVRRDSGTSDVHMAYFEDFLANLQMQVGVAHQPLCLYLAFAMSAVETIDRDSFICERPIGEIEALTGITPSCDPDIVNNASTVGHASLRADMEGATNSSRRVSGLLETIEHTIWQLNSLQRTTDSLIQAGFANIPGRAGDTIGSEVETAMQLLRQRIDPWETRLSCVRETSLPYCSTLLHASTRPPTLL